MLGEIECPEGLFIDVLGVGCGRTENVFEGMLEHSRRLTEKFLDSGERYKLVPVC